MHSFPRARSSYSKQATRLFAALAALGPLALGLSAQITFSESFTGTSAPGWVFGGNYTPWLTAGTNPNGGPSAIDPDGNGWLRLTDNGANRSTYALLDTQVFSVNARIEITMDYAFWNGTGADGITFFLIDGSVDNSNFAPGAFGGSLGYAQKTAIPGMTGGYLGFGLDNWGNYSNNGEGRNGGLAAPTLYPNRVAVRGPESSNYAFIAASNPLPEQMDFPGYTSRPVQTGADYRSLKIILDANNQLDVQMKFGASSSFASVFTADLSAYERPETFKIGFTGSTGGANEIHEIRNFTLVSTPWSSGVGAYEWDNGAGTSTWGTTAGGETNYNWYSDTPANDNKTPLQDSDILFGNRPTSGPQTVTANNNVEVRNLTFDTSYDYTLNGTGTLTFGDTSKPGLPSINVNNYNGVNDIGRHKINNTINVVENLAVRNFSSSTLCLNGAMNLGANTLTTSGYGLTNFNGQITGSGPIIVNGATFSPHLGSGMVVVSANNSSTYTGAITVNEGQLIVMNNGALGTTSTGTTVTPGGTVTFRGNITTSEPFTLTGVGTSLAKNNTPSGVRSAGALYNDGGNNTVNGTITLAGDTAIGSRAGNLTINGVIGQTGGARSLTKLDNGVVTLNAANTYTGATRIEGGALRITGAESSLPGGFATGGPSGGNLTLAGGVLEIGVATNFTRALGTGADQVQWTGDGGFSAFGGARTVTLSGGTLTWGSGSFVPTGNALLLSSDFANNTVTFSNAINLGTELREVRVANGSAAVDGILSGVLSGTGGLRKTGEGTLQLTANNTYTGITQIDNGALRFTNTNQLDGSNIQLNGGVLELAGTNMTRNLGVTGNDIRWVGDGGFAAAGANRNINLNNSTATVTWDSTPNFVAAGNRLILGSTSATHTVLFNNGLATGGTAADIRVIHTVRGTSTTFSEARLVGVVSGAAGIAVTGNGRLEMSANNTHTGTITLTGAELRLTGANGALTSSADFTVKDGGNLILDNQIDLKTNRLNNSANVTLSGGSLTLIGNSNNGSVLIEDINNLLLNRGDNTVQITVNNFDNATRNHLSIDALIRNAGATLNFISNTSDANSFGTNISSYRPAVSFTSPPSLESSILPYATVTSNNSTVFAGHSLSNGIIRVAGTNTAQASWNSSIIANNTSSQTLDANRTVGALILGSGINVSEDTTPRILTVQTGGILSTGAASSTISVSNLQVGGTGNRELFAHVYGTGGLIITSSIQNNGNTTSLTKSGDGTLTLAGGTANTYTGITVVNGGALVLNKTPGVTAIAGDLIVGDGRGVDILRLDANHQIADTATVTLRGGEVGNSNNVARFELNGATSETPGSREERVAILNIEGNSILDFGGGTPCSPTYLRLNELNVAANSLLTITNWIEFTDFLLVDKTSFDSTQLSRVIFDGYGGSATWKQYDANFYQITPFLPVPEPASFGLLSLGGLGVFYALRRSPRRTRALR